MSHPQTGDAVKRFRLERQVLHVHILGPRAVAELLFEFAAAVRGKERLEKLLNDYCRLSPEWVRVAGGDRFAPPPLTEVPAKGFRRVA